MPVELLRHAGYSYSGSAAAWAYRALDLSKAYAHLFSYLFSPPSLFRKKDTKHDQPLTIPRYIVLLYDSSKRIFLLGPSHHYYLSGCALTRCDSYETPLGALKIDTATTAELHRTGKFETMSIAADEDEHSLEMHLPYIYTILSRYEIIRLSLFLPWRDCLLVSILSALESSSHLVRSFAH